MDEERPRRPSEAGASRTPWILLAGLVFLAIYTAVNSPSGQHSNAGFTTSERSKRKEKSTERGREPVQDHERIGAYSKEPFRERIVHFDMKGAPPRLQYLKRLFPRLKLWGATAILFEYEDMFPYTGELEVLRATESYNPEEIDEINRAAEEAQLEVVPLVQTFGHMEFVLKNAQFRNLSENYFETNTICPSDNASIVLIHEIIKQVRLQHPNSRRIHIGADEAYHVAEDERCNQRLVLDTGLNMKTERLKLSHIARVAKMARALGFTEVLAWNDMFASTEAAELNRFNFSSLLVPIIWGYAVDVTSEGYFPLGLFERLRQVFPKVYFASAYKGANGKEQTFLDIDRYLSNHISFTQLYRINRKEMEGRLAGLVLTGWSRFWHRAPLCELLPTGWPSLAINMAYLQDVYATPGARTTQARRWLNCPLVARPSERMERRRVLNETFYPPKEIIFAECEFDGADVFELGRNPSFQVEKLRFATWKVNRFEERPEQFAKLRTELDELHSKVREVFPKYFYEETINEWLHKNLDSLRFRLRSAENRATSTN